MWGKDENDGSDEENEDEDNYKTVNDHIIFLIDARPDMFLKNNNGEVFIIVAVRY
jgi:hypothetical protein